MKRFILLIITALTLSSCAKDNSPIIFTLDPVAALNTGTYVAYSKSFIPSDQVDLKLSFPLIEPVFQPLIDGRSNIVSATLNQAIIAEANGLDLVNILQLSQATPLRLFTKSEISSIKELEGKKVGYIESDGSKEIIDLLSHLKGVKFELDASDALNKFNNNELDAIILKEYKEMYMIPGIITEEVSVYNLSEMGFDIPDVGLYCLKSDYSKRKDDYNAIAEAIQKGWEYTASDLNDAFVILCANLGETSEEDRAYYFWQMSNFSNHQIDPIANKRIFTLFDEAVEVYCELYMQAGIIKESVDL